MSLFDVLKQLEESLWLPESRFDNDYMNQLLDNDFFEFGRSGKIYTREECMSHPYQEIYAKIPLEKLQVLDITDDVKQVTYISEVGIEKLRANRSSIWVRIGGKWRLRFHQGTPI